MNLRDKFAAAAMIGLIIGHELLQDKVDKNMDSIPTIDDEAEDAYRIADAMIRARTTRKGPSNES